VMKSNSDNFRQSAIINIMNYLKIRGYSIIIFEPLISESSYCGYEINNDIESFKNLSDIIVTNRYNSSLASVASKVYTRDLYLRD